ncbi:MAG: nucleotidyltransferase family protein [Bacteroidia bacterium]|nr:nucleotidyltransferase family protein [Bacteroidia bacterium]
MTEHLSSIPIEALTALCGRYHVKKLSLFGSILGQHFTDSSDIDVLVEFHEGHVPGFAFITMQDELEELLHRRVDLHTPNSLSKYFREEVMQHARVLYAE